MTEEVQESLHNVSIAYVIDDKRLAINRGERHGVRLGQRFLVYNLSDEEILDPVTKKSLGRLEIFKGTGRVVHVQDTISTIESDRPAASPELEEIRPVVPSVASPREALPRNTLPFVGVRVGDRAKLISF